MQAFTKVGLEALLTPDNCVVVLIDHQPFQLANVNSHEPTMVINNVIALAKTAKAYGIPTVETRITITDKETGNAAERFSASFRRSFRIRSQSTAPSSMPGRTIASSKQ